MTGLTSSILIKTQKTHLNLAARRTQKESCLFDFRSSFFDDVALGFCGSPPGHVFSQVRTHILSRRQERFVGFPQNFNETYFKLQNQQTLFF